MLKKIGFALAGITLLASPVIASAQSVSDLQAQLNALLAQLQSLQSLVNQGTQTPPTTNPSQPDDYGTGSAPTGVYCPSLSVTMQRGARDATTGGQVSELQAFLTDYYNLDDGLVNGGFFGKLTEQYVIQFQNEQGLPAFGIAGQLTRAKIATVCGTSTPTTAQTGTYIAYINGSAFTTGSNVTQAYALSQCQALTPAHTAETIRCTWNGTEIYKTSPASGAASATIDQGSLTQHSPNFSVGGLTTANNTSNIFVELVDSSYSGPTDYNSLYNLLKGSGQYNAVGNTAIVSQKACSATCWDASFNGVSNGTYTVYVFDGDNPSAWKLLTTGTLTVGGTTSSAGTLSVTTDGSNPLYQVVAAGSTGVTASVYKFHASGESIQLNRIGLLLPTSASYQDISHAYIYDGSTLVGSVVFSPTSGLSVAVLTSPVTIPKDGDKIITIKVDIASIGVGQPGKSGDLITIWPATDTVGRTEGTGLTTGANIVATSPGYKDFTGVRIFRSYPTVVQVSLSSSGLTNGTNSILRFSVTANSSGAIGLYKFGINLSASQAALTLPTYGVYSDPQFSQSVSGFTQSTNGIVYQSSALSSSGVFAGGQVGVFLGSTGHALQIPAGATYYFEIRDSITTNGANPAITASLDSDSSYQSFINANGVDVIGSNFFWSPNDNSTSQFSDSDWTNGYNIPGLAAGSITQTRTGSGTVTCPPGQTLQAGTCVSPAIGATIDASSANATSATPTITGTATAGTIAAVSITITDSGGGLLFNSGSYSAGSGSWSIPVTTSLPNGQYVIKVYSNGNFLTSGPLTVSAAAPSAIVQPVCSSTNIGNNIHDGAGYLQLVNVSLQECQNAAYAAKATVIEYSSSGNYPLCVYGPDSITSDMCGPNGCGCNTGSCWPNTTKYSCTYSTSANSKESSNLANAYTALQGALQRLLKLLGQ